MPNAAEAALLVAAAVAIQTAWAADPAIRIEPAVSGSGAVELNTAPPALDGAQLFATHCAMCHKSAELARRLQSAADPKAARADIATFLARHGRSDADADGAIIDYLANTRRHSSVEQTTMTRASAACRSWLPTTLISINERQILRRRNRGPGGRDAGDGDRRKAGSLSGFQDGKITLGS